MRDAFGFNFLDRPISVESLSALFGWSRGFVNLCVAAGCRPNAAGQLAPAKVVRWLLAHSNAVRSVAGLSPLAGSATSDPVATADRQIQNFVATVQDYAISRSPGAVLQPNPWTS